MKIVQGSKLVMLCNWYIDFEMVPFQWRWISAKS